MTLTWAVIVIVTYKLFFALQLTSRLTYCTEMPSRQFPTLTKVSGHLEGIVSSKNTRYENIVLMKTCFCILAEISTYHLQLKCMGGHFFPWHFNIESTTVLSD